MHIELGEKDDHFSRSYSRSSINWLQNVIEYLRRSKEMVCIAYNLVIDKIIVLFEFGLCSQRLISLPTETRKIMFAILGHISPLSPFCVLFKLLIHSFCLLLKVIYCRAE